jgi:imidazoleglycerol-phosphate dehydratase
MAVKINLDGNGAAQVNTGIAFFDHMLKSLCRFACFDMEFNAQGDLAVDAHHTIEDSGIVIGQAIRRALGEIKGIERVGQALLPMDEALVQVALDVANRPYLAWKMADMDGSVGEFPVEMAEEFFRALTVHAGLTLHIQVLAGRNRHHVLESMFKGVGMALRLALAANPRFDGVPSTKGVL